MENYKEKFRPVLSKNEFKFITDNLNNGDRLLEYGCGGSTIHFQDMVKEMYSIEHSEHWYNIISEIVNDNVTLKHIKLNISSDHLRCDYRDESHIKLFEPYYTAAKLFNVDKFDKVFIDGRSRAYCARDVIKYIDENSLVFIHDYTIRDWYFDIVESHYDIIDKMETMVMLKKK